MQDASRTILDAMKLIVAFHTGRTQGTSHRTGIKGTMARQDLLQDGSLPGSSADFTGRQSDTKGTVTTILDLCIRHAS